MIIDAVVVTYNADENIIDNIHSYLNYVNTLFVIDNSDNPNNELANKILSLSDKCTYISNNSNKGIAQALNLGAKLAIDNGAQWLLTMDQDTSFRNDECRTLIEVALDTDIETVAIIGPSHHEDENMMNNFYETMVMTSGNLVNLNIFQKLKGFDEKLFIDSVDVEYCLRIYQNNYLIKRLPNIILEHNLGNKKKYKILGVSFTPTNHNHIRRYYITRNRLHVWSKYKKIYPEYIKSERILSLKEFIKIILFEEKKIKKMKYMVNGYIDFKNNKFGKLE